MKNIGFITTEFDIVIEFDIEIESEINSERQNRKVYGENSVLVMLNLFQHLNKIESKLNSD
jgi:hypothetical protein